MAKQTESAAGATFEAAARGGDTRQDLLPREKYLKAVGFMAGEEREE